MEINADLKKYVEREILPQYHNFDKGHQIDHVQKVIDDSLILARDYDVDINMVYAIAAYHDVGIGRGRELHHIYSGEFLLADKNLQQWFTAEQIATMRDAVEDHRASNKHEPRTIYGKIVAEADRDISPQNIVRRTIQFGLKKYPNENFEFQFERTYSHIQEKYGVGGYLKLYLHSPKNEQGLSELRKIVDNKDYFRNLCKQIYDCETTKNS